MDHQHMLKIQKYQVFIKKKVLYQKYKSYLIKKKLEEKLYWYKNFVINVMQQRKMKRENIKQDDWRDEKKDKRKK